MRRHRLALGLFAVGAGLLAGCLSPTLPLPPPDEPDSIRMGVCDGSVCSWEIAGSCDPGSRVTVIDEATGIGAVFEDRKNSGRYIVTLLARQCDLASVTVERDGETSSPTKFVIDPVLGGMPSPDAGACK